MQNDIIFTKIDDLVKNNDIVLFIKGTRDIPLCGFSARVVAILNHLKLDFIDINILEDEAMRQGIKNYSDWPTIPQLYIKGSFLGGCDITKEMFESGELQELLRAKNLMS